MSDDEEEVAVDGDENGVLLDAEGEGESSDDEGSTGAGIGDKHTIGRGCKTRQKAKLLRVSYTSNSFVAIHDGQQNVVETKCCIIDCTGKVCGMTVKMIQISSKNCWNHHAQVRVFEQSHNVRLHNLL